VGHFLEKFWRRRRKFSGMFSFRYSLNIKENVRETSQVLMVVSMKMATF
jgi:hypothetical protein